ncbi:NAD(P)-dependent oxidoreductase [Pollutimonas bauzanensis]|uniref:NAD(P)-dependent oxidoreductase n=1 Tax=Pollutimonas bauzanensis TaxID=658167 RepID=UPI0009339764|nr:NAD(P)-dependent oxidoreductase [Pollutimonas bauzanensis]
MIACSACFQQTRPDEAVAAGGAPGLFRAPGSGLWRDETRHLVAERHFQRMKPSARLVDVSRGGVVD